MTGETFDSSETAEHPALKGFNRTWEYVKHVAKKTLIIALKGAVVLGIMGTVLSFFGAVPAKFLESIPVLGKYLGYGLTQAGASSDLWLLGGLKTGALLGGIGGAMIGLANGVSGAEDAVEDAEQSRMAQYNKGQQMAMNRSILQRMAMGVGTPSQPGMMAPGMAGMAPPIGHAPAPMPGIPGQPGQGYGAYRSS